MSNYFSSSEKARDESDDERSAGARYASGLITCSATERSILSTKLLQRRLLLLLLRTRHQHNKRRVDVSTYPTTAPQQLSRQAPADVASPSHSLTPRSQIFKIFTFSRSFCGQMFRPSAPVLTSFCTSRGPLLIPPTKFRATP